MPFGFDKSDARALRDVGALSAVGLAFVLALVIGFGVGHWLDGRFHTSPWLTIIGFLFGLVAGILNVYRAVSRALGPPFPRE